MWHLQHIKAFNICAFKELDYWFHEKRTTLIFGNNQDNDSQGSNGSGKSALLEAIAISLTGETLRKVKMEEIINDAADDAGIYMTLWNDSTGTTMDITRFLSRKSAQEIHVDLTNIANSEHQKITQPSVAEYNKYILETLGLSKDDIFTNFILSKHKYVSFLSSSDKDKKELINRFSNGVMVDESIAALQADMEPVQEALKEAQDKVNFCSGQVTALNAQIAQTEEKSLQNGRSKQERIEKIREDIAAKRESIRIYNSVIDEANDKLDLIDVFDIKRAELEERQDLTVQEIFKVFAKEANNLTKKGVEGFSQFTDYSETVKSYQSEVKELNKKHKEVEKDLNTLQKKSEHLVAAHSKLEERFNKFSSEFAGKDKKLTDKLDKFKDSIIHLQLNSRKLTEQRNNLSKDVARLNNMIAGVIECPKCHYEFLLQADVDLEETRTQIKEREYEIADIDKCISNNTEEISQIDESSREITLKHQDLQRENIEWSKKITESQLEIDRLNRTLESAKNDLEHYNAQILKVQRNIDEAGEKMFDEFYDMDVAATEFYNKVIDRAEEGIKIDEGTIKSLEDSIEAIQNTSESDLIDSMKNTLVEYEANLAEAEKKEFEIQGQLNNMKAQETNFIEFKSYLANQKIDALSQMTNEFLEAIGSDIRIVFSGFTVLKSGKIREKISISLVRDGVDCGSFDKFSEGEKARVNLANILAMHKLTNLNCDDDKGLDILILDEILEATDEQGLSNIFTALNKLELTALVVSHGNIAENYPYKTVVTKLNGISTIND